MGGILQFADYAPNETQFIIIIYHGLQEFH